MTDNKVAILFGVLGVAVAVLATAGWADDRPSVFIQRIDVRGNQQISAPKIVRVLGIKPGEPYDPERIRPGLKRLYDTMQFRDVRAYRNDGSASDSVVVVVEVAEFPRIDEVRFEGDDHMSHEDLTKAIVVTKGTFVRPSLVSRDREAIGDLYKEKGYYSVAVSDSIHKDAREGTQALVYVIKEGEKMKVRHVDFVGARLVDTETIRKSIKTKPKGFLRGGDFSPKQLAEDREAIITLYKTYGFIDATVNEPELEFADNRKDVDVYFTIGEGKQYYVGDVDWKGNELLPDSVIAGSIRFSKGQVFNDIALTQMQFDLANLYGDRGYIYANVTPVKKVRGNVIDLTFEIQQGNLAHVREINIAGNTKTWEEVIRRELVLMPGDVFSSNRLRRSLREVFNLGFFAGPPEPQVTQANDEGDVDLTLRVEEKSAGQFRVGAGFSQLNRVSGFIGITEPNFLGRGYRVSGNWEFSRSRQDVSLSFTQPWAFGTPTELSFSVYAANQDRVQQQFYSDRRTGFSIRVGRPFPWLDYTTASVRYSLEEVELADFTSGYNGPLRFETWPQTTSAIGLTLYRNSTDNPFHPTLGTRTTLNARWTGGALGGDVDIQRYEIDMSWYQSLLWKFVLELRENLGVVDGYAGSTAVPDYERFRLGGNRRYGVRGYDFYEITPRGNDSFTGGLFYSITVVQIEFPIMAPTVYGRTFLDMGGTWNSFGTSEWGDLFKGAGLGVVIELPMIGLFGFDYAYGFDRFGGARWEPHITFGSSF